MKTLISVLLASTFCFAVTAEAKMKKKAAKEACVAEGKVNAKGKADPACVKEKMKH